MFKESCGLNQGNFTHQNLKHNPAKLKTLTEQKLERGKVTVLFISDKCGDMSYWLLL